MNPSTNLRVRTSESILTRSFLGCFANSDFRKFSHSIYHILAIGESEIIFGLLDPSFSHAIPDDTMKASGPESQKCVRRSGP